MPTVFELVNVIQILVKKATNLHEFKMIGEMGRQWSILEFQNVPNSGK